MVMQASNPQMLIPNITSGLLLLKLLSIKRKIQEKNNQIKTSMFITEIIYNLEAANNDDNSYVYTDLHPIDKDIIINGLYVMKQYVKFSKDDDSISYLSQIIDFVDVL
jgi:hypothetical protein